MTRDDVTRVVIADDQALFREGLRTLLSTRSDMEVVGEAATGEEAVALVQQLRPSVVLMDLRMPKLDGIEATARLRERCPEIPILVLTTFDDDANLFGALRAGATGYLLKDVSSETLVSAIHAATRGESFLQSTVTGRVVAAFARLMESGGPKTEALVLPLSPREREIVSLLGSGASNKEIADRLNLAEGTVKNHVTSILTKLDVRDRTQAALRARQLGIV
jgi:DNA-binding NarL/FixJ family response regulator